MSPAEARPADAGAGPEESRHFPGTPASVGAARGHARRLVGDPELRPLVELIVSELATNALRHAGTGFDLRISSRAGRIRGSVTDRGGGTPVLRETDGPLGEHAGALGEQGRGLRIVDRLAAAWGVEWLADGKRVWFEL